MGVPAGKSPGATPMVSVILPTYNGRTYVGAAIQSILAQSFANYEFIIIDDGSRDGTPDVIREYSDPRVQLTVQENRGLAATLNCGIEMARGRYVARLDQDDWSLPQRLERQVAYMEEHPQCGLLGTWAEIWQGDQPTGRVHSHPADSTELKAELLLNNPFVHSSAMLRRAVIEDIGTYTTDMSRQPPEDFELWSRIARKYDVANIPEVLHVYREVQGSMSRAAPSPFIEHLVTICAENVAWASRTNPSDPTVMNIAALQHGALHRMAGEPDFVAMRRVFQQAIGRVTGDVRYRHAADRRIDALRRRWWDVRYGHGWRRRAARATYALARLAGRS